MFYKADGSLVLLLMVQEWDFAPSYTEFGISQIIASLPLILWDSLVFLDLGMATSVSIHLAESVCPPHLSLFRPSSNGGGWLSCPLSPFFFLPIIQVEVQSNIFQGKGKGNFRKWFRNFRNFRKFNFSPLVSGNKRRLDGRRPRKKGVAYQNLQQAGNGFLWGPGL